MVPGRNILGSRNQKGFSGQKKNPLRFYIALLFLRVYSYMTQARERKQARERERKGERDTDSEVVTPPGL